MNLLRSLWMSLAVVGRALAALWRRDVHRDDDRDGWPYDAAPTRGTGAVAAAWHRCEPFVAVLLVTVVAAALAGAALLA